MSYVTPQELIYRALASPKTPETKPAPLTADPKKAALSRDDVNAILQRKRSASAEELQHILDNAKLFALTSGELNQISVDMTIAIAQRSRAVEGRREDPTTRLIYDLGYAITPFGLLAERVWFERELQNGTKAIAACRRHSPPQCSCWKAVRETLYSVRASFGEKSPEAWMATKLYEALEELEAASRPEITEFR